MTKKLTRRAVVGGLAGLAAGTAAAEPDWPTRTITIIHGFPAGGPSDIIARIISDGLSRALGQAVIVEAPPRASTHTPLRPNHPIATRTKQSGRTNSAAELPTPHPNRPPPLPAAPRGPRPAPPLPTGLFAMPTKTTARHTPTRPLLNPTLP